MAHADRATGEAILQGLAGGASARTSRNLVWLPGAVSGRLHGDIRSRGVGGPRLPSRRAPGDRRGRVLWPSSSPLRRHPMCTWPCAYTPTASRARTRPSGAGVARPGSGRATIVKWAVLSAVVGTVIHRQLPGAPRPGRPASSAWSATGWAVATFMVVPVLAFEDVGPFEALTPVLVDPPPRGSARWPAADSASASSSSAYTVGAIAVSVLWLLSVSAAGLPVIGVPVFVLGVLTVVGIGMYASAAGMCIRGIPLPLRHRPAHPRPRGRRVAGLPHPGRPQVRQPWRPVDPRSSRTGARDGPPATRAGRRSAR